MSAFGRMLLLALAPALLSACSQPGRVPEAVVARKNLVEWSNHEGVLEARRVETLISEYAGSAIIIELAPEGRFVRRGDIVVRFDDAAARRETVRTQRDFEIARLDLETLEQATIPMEMDKQRMAVLEGQVALQTEKEYLESCQQLQSRGMMTQKELEKQKIKTQQADIRLRSAERELELMTAYLNSSRVERARATLLAADQEKRLAEEQLERCIIRAPVDGMVVHKPVHVGGEYRMARVGDTVQKNQPLMAIPDVSDWTVTCYVPEIDLQRVRTGRLAVVRPLAYPSLNMTGAVETISTMAEAKPDRGNWEKHFRATLALHVPEGERGLLRSGLSVNAAILADQRTHALALPRTFVEWRDQQPWVKVRNWKGVDERMVELGLGTSAEFEVLAGLAEGDRVVQP